MLESVLSRRKDWMTKVKEMTLAKQCMWRRCKETDQERDCERNALHKYILYIIISN